MGPEMPWSDPRYRETDDTSPQNPQGQRQSTLGTRTPHVHLTRIIITVAPAGDIDILNDTAPAFSSLLDWSNPRNCPTSPPETLDDDLLPEVCTCYLQTRYII